jgi:hypothetical protein
MHSFMKSWGGWPVKVTATIVGATLIIWVVYAGLLIKTPYPLVADILIAAGFGFYHTRQKTGLSLAIVGAVVVAALVLYLSLFLIVNTLGA